MPNSPSVFALAHPSKRRHNVTITSIPSEKPYVGCHEKARHVNSLGSAACVRHRRPGSDWQGACSGRSTGSGPSRDRDIGHKSAARAGRKLSRVVPEKSDTVRAGKRGKSCPELTQGQYDQHALKKIYPERGPDAAGGLSATLAVLHSPTPRIFSSPFVPTWPRGPTPASTTSAAPGRPVGGRKALHVRCRCVLACSPVGSP